MPDQQPETVVRDSLERLVGYTKRADSRGLLDEMERLDSILAASGGRLPPRLAHFLQNRSYAKALQLLSEAEAAPKGRCRPGEG